MLTTDTICYAGIFIAVALVCFMHSTTGDQLDYASAKMGTVKSPPQNVGMHVPPSVTPIVENNAKVNTNTQLDSAFTEEKDMQKEADALFAKSGVAPDFKPDIMRKLTGSTFQNPRPLSDSSCKNPKTVGATTVDWLPTGQSRQCAAPEVGPFNNSDIHWCRQQACVEKKQTKL